MKKNKILVGALIATSLLTWAAKDPTLMNINGKDVKLSEFEYLYQKNNQQQIEKESLDKYVDRFITYKLKVAEAAEAGVDTTKSFKNELSGYQNDLARPYLTDSVALKRLAHEAYNRMGKEISISHIMVNLGGSPSEDAKMEAFADSIRTRILSGENFEELAKKYSIDPSAKQNNGDLGYIVQGRYPYAFEYVAYNTPKGDISKVFKTNYGYHFIRVNDIRDSRGQVHVEHIMKLFPRGASDSIKALKKASIDSIYKAVKSGANFEELARKLSEDPGSASKGGELPWFGSGRMVKEFDKVAFDLNDGEISEPFQTQFGYHIVKKLGHKGVDAYETVEKQLIKEINNDERQQIIEKDRVAKLKTKYGYKVNSKLKSYLKNRLEKAGGYDSAFVANLKQCNYEMFRINGTKYEISNIVPFLNPMSKISANQGVDYIMKQVETCSDMQTLKYEKDNLANEHPEYRNLLNEYKDGMMLYEISNKKVWDKAVRDTEGLEKYFQDHKSTYCTWKEPMFKGTIIYVKNDSLIDKVKEAAKSLGGDTIASALRKQFKRDIRIDKVIVSKGMNAQVDELVFHGEKKLPSDKRFTSYFILEGKLIDQPEEAADVRGKVASDYQNYLEEEWVKELKSKYKVTINKKILDKLR